MTDKYPAGYWLNKESKKFLSEGYLLPEQTAEERIDLIVDTFAKYATPEIAAKFKDYLMNGWYSLASPIWSNYGTDRGLPISCNGTYIDDDMESILFAVGEIGMQTKYGSGTSGYVSKIRGRGSKIQNNGFADGPLPFMELYDKVTNVVSQSNVRRGSCAIYMDLDHPDIKEFLEVREEGAEIQKLSIGVCISDEWMTSMRDGDSEKRKIWTRVLRKRFETGYPYLFFKDTVNSGKADIYHELDMPIYASNLCSEITLPSNNEYSFVCCLSSMNVLHFDEWRDTDAVEILTHFLDSVMDEYVHKTNGNLFMRRANAFARDHRAIGIGTLGYHSYLQSKSYPFDSDEARAANIDIHKTIFTKAMRASEILATVYGPAPLFNRAKNLTPRRNTTVTAIAPTTSSSFILGQVSPSIEPLNSNYFTKDLAKLKSSYKNPYLKEVLKKHDCDLPEVWDIILKDGGSVQSLFFLTDHEKEVFKTFGEISQAEIIQQAADRQKYLDQSQSLNLMIHPNTPLKDINLLLIDGWEKGIKTFYYQRSTNPSQELVRSLTQCKACEA